MRSVLVFCLCATFIACTSFQRTTGGQWVPGQVFNFSGIVLIMPVKDAEQARVGVISGSGQGLVSSIRDALLKRGVSVMVGESSSLSSAFDEAERLKCSYVLRATFTEWGQHSTEWSAIPTSAAVSAELYQVNGKSLVSTATHRDVGSSVTWVHEDVSRFIPELGDSLAAKLTNTAPRVWVSN